MKINENRPIVLAAKKCSSGTLVPSKIRLMQIFTKRLPRDGTSMVSGLVENKNFQCFH